MAGTRTAPTVNGTPTFLEVSLHLLDASGDFGSDMIVVPATVTDAEIETYVAAYQLATNATIWKVEVRQLYTSVAQTSNADNTPRASNFQVVNTMAKNSALASQNGVVRAPEDAMFVSGTDQVDTGQALYVTYLAALLDLLNGGALGSGDYVGYSVRYSERKEINTRTLI